MLNIAKYSPEGIADGESRIEIELVYHAILEDMSVLETAAKKEVQEQWEIKIEKTEPSVTPRNLTGGRLRVRKINNGEKYVFCSKTKDGDHQQEIELESTEDQFRQFVGMATGGMLKTRYYFPIEGTEGSFPEGEFDGKLVWEIDVFKKHPDEPDQEWVKIDLEMPENWNKEIPIFPFDTKQLITSQYPNRPENEEVVVSRLYDQDFMMRH